MRILRALLSGALMVGIVTWGFAYTPPPPSAHRVVSPGQEIDEFYSPWFMVVTYPDGRGPERWDGPYSLEVTCQNEIEEDYVTQYPRYIFGCVRQP